jgi:hypothetical protein
MALYIKIALIAGTILLTGCKAPEAPLPLPGEKIAEVLADLHLAENAAHEAPAETKDSLKQLYYQRIFRDQGIDEKVFEECIRLLNQNPAQLTGIYTRVHEILVTREAEAGAGNKDKAGGK